MAFPIIPKKRSGATGNPSTLELGELATNTQTGELFLGGDGGVMLINAPTAAGTTVTEHPGDGTTTAFTFTGYSSTNDGAYLVSVGGIDQPPSKYSVSSANGGTITFVEAPVAGEIISIRAIVAGSGGGGGGITELTGDVTASGTGSVAATLATVTTAQSNVGSETAIPVISVDEKGRVLDLTTVQFAGLTTTQIAGLTTVAPAALSTEPVAGLSHFAARADHQHLMPSAADVGALGATAAAGGDLTGNFPNPTLAAITTAQNDIGSSTVVPVLSVDDKGRVTSLTTAPISGNATQLQGIDISTTAPTAGQSLVYNATTQKWEPAGGAYEIEFLIVAGGGGGGASDLGSFRGGGGGAGGVITTTAFVLAGSYTITIGAGGTGSLAYNAQPSDANGVTTTVSGPGFTTQTAIGGGGGGQAVIDTSQNLGASGGSGGGGGNSATDSGTFAGGSGTIGQGFAGGAGQHVAGNWATGGGGGGATTVGVSPAVQSDLPNGGAGLDWLSLGIYYGGGGGGAGTNPVIGIGGAGGGGNGNPFGAGVNGTANSGGGGGGGGTGGNGGSGVVILRYSGSQRGTGGTVTTADGFTYHTFTTSGIYVA